MRLPARALLVGAVSVALSLTGLTPVQAKECGCTQVGDFVAPDTEAPATGASSPNGDYTLTTSQNGTFVDLTVRRASNNSVVETFSARTGRLQFGWSPDGDRFLYRYAFPGSEQTHDQVNVYDLAADQSRLSTTLTAGAAAAFSPHGEYFFTKEITQGNFASLEVRKASTGQVRWSTSYVFQAPPGNPGQTFSVEGTGFSPDAEDRSFLLAYRDNNGQTQLQVRNLASQSNVVSQTISGGAYWRFSKCGDAFGLVTQSGSSQINARLFKTYAGLNAGLGQAQTLNMPGSFKFTNDLSKHKFSYVTPQGSNVTNLADNTADQQCAAAPALDSVTFNPSVLTGSGQSSTGKVTLTAASTSPVTVALSVSDGSALTLPSSVTVPANATTKTFSVTSKSVSTTKTPVVTASYSGVQKTATVTVNPAPATAAPKVSNLAVDDPTVVGGSGTTATVTLDIAAPASGTAVTLSSSDPGVAQVGASTTVTSGQTSKTFAVQTASVTANTPVTLTATAGGQSRSATLTVTPATQSENPHAVIADNACQASTLPANDDGSTGLVALPFDINYFGTQYGALYVNNNGNVTFTSPMSTYTPFTINANVPPIIAPFFADVDTRSFGSRQVTHSTSVTPATFGGRPAFCANWVDVGYYNTHSDRTNSFQLLLVDRSDVAPGDFDIVFNYDRIRWENGDVSSVAAGAGYSAGNGNPAQFFEIPGSRQFGAFLDSNATTGLTRTSRGTLQLGRQVFEVRNGAAPTGGTLTGVVTNDANPAVPQPGAPVQICPAAGGQCAAFTVTGANGRYTVAGLAEGSYTVRVSPPTGSTASPVVTPAVDVTAGASTTRDVVLDSPNGPPPGTTITPSSTNGQGIPSVYWGNALDLDTEGCPGGTASYVITQGGQEIAAGPMQEEPSGHYSAQVEPLRPNSGQALVTITIDCPEPAADEAVSFNIYIDPSGNVRTPSGDPVVGATVTLYRSDNETGPFEPVVDGSAIMSPANRNNPDLTDADGHFGWDVVTGYYKVRAEKEGCTAPGGAAYAETDVLPVPPPVFDLDLRLVCAGTDIAKPTVGSSVSPATTTNGWHSAPVTVTFDATDAGEDASGVESITYALTGAQAGGATVTGSTASVVIDQDGTTDVTFFATDAAGNVSDTGTRTVRVDRTAPVLTCSVDKPLLTPADNTLRAVRATVAVTDETSGSAGFKLVNAISDEYDVYFGSVGIGFFGPGDILDWKKNTADVAGQLRARRFAQGDGRVYTLIYEARDRAGNTARCMPTVEVPL